jgi:hypothetical protein
MGRKIAGQDEVIEKNVKAQLFRVPPSGTDELSRSRPEPRKPTVARTTNSWKGEDAISKRQVNCPTAGCAAILRAYEQPAVHLCMGRQSVQCPGPVIGRDFQPIPRLPGGEVTGGIQA